MQVLLGRGLPEYQHPGPAGPVGQFPIGWLVADDRSKVSNMLHDIPGPRPATAPHGANDLDRHKPGIRSVGYRVCVMVPSLMRIQHTTLHKKIRQTATLHRQPHTYYELLMLYILNLTISRQDRPMATRRVHLHTMGGFETPSRLCPPEHLVATPRQVLLAVVAPFWGNTDSPRLYIRTELPDPLHPFLSSLHLFETCKSYHSTRS